MSFAALAISTIEGTPVLYSVPVDDLEEFLKLSEARRVEVQVTLRILSRLAEEIPQRGKMAALRWVASVHSHQMRGLSAQSLDRKWKAYQAGGWRALVKGYRCPNVQPAEFVEELRRVAELNHRSQGEAFRQIRERWAAGHSIPGYGTWIDFWCKVHPDKPVPMRWPRDFYPAGWSIDNLRRYGPAKATRVLAQRGLAAAKKHFPSIQRDPSQLRPLELVVIDDFELDTLCVFPGDKENRAQIAPVAGLLAMDVATRRKLVWGLGPRIERDERQPDGTIKKVRSGIRRVDVQMLLHDLFEKYGLPDYTVTLLVENATASISPELELAFTTIFEGRVKVERTGLIKHRTLTNGFVERGGKPWQKGWIESLFNSLWNTLGAQKGYKGSNARLNGPASLDDAKRYTAKLLRGGEKEFDLPPEAIREMHFPFQTPEELEAAFAWACELSDIRTDHKYIGFSRVTEFLLPGYDEPQSFGALALIPPEQQVQVQPVERMESSVECWARKCSVVSFRSLPRNVLDLLLLTPKRVEYRNRAITFSHERVGHTYVDRSGSVLSGICEGTEFLAYFNPAAPELLQLATLTGGYVGALERLGGRHGAIDIRDKDALRDAAAVAETIINRAVAEVRQRHAGDDQQLAADRIHNEAVVEKYRALAQPLQGTSQVAEAVAHSSRAQTERKQRAQALQSLSDEDVPNLL